MKDGQKAIAALEKLAEGLGSEHGISALGDFVYNIREEEGEGWNGRRVTAWAEGCRLAKEALGE